MATRSQLSDDMTIIPGQGKSGTKSLMQEGAYQISGTD